jgi:L-rhamnose mutarotase
MPRYAWVLEVRPGYEEEYVRRQEIWPEMVESLRSAGIRNYSIFRHGLTLFGYFETDDIQETQKYLANDETNRRWSEWMDPIMKVDIDPSTQFPYLLPCSGTWIDLTPGPLAAGVRVADPRPVSPLRSPLFAPWARSSCPSLRAASGPLRGPVRRVPSGAT